MLIASYNLYVSLDNALQIFREKPWKIRLPRLLPAFYKCLPQLYFGCIRAAIRKTVLKCESGFSYFPPIPTI